MNITPRTIAIRFGIISLFVSSCGPGQLPNPTLTRTSASALTPTSALLPTSTLLSASTPTPTTLPKKFNPANGHWYSAVYLSMNWMDAKEYCRKQQAYLVTIASQQENQFVFKLNPNSWIGLGDAVDEGNWKWVTEEPVNYTNWAPNEPNNCTDCTSTSIKEGEDAAHFNDSPPDQWNDWPSIEVSSFVCEGESSK